MRIPNELQNFVKQQGTILVTGSRSLANNPAAQDLLLEKLSPHATGRQVLIVGDAGGIDRMAYETWVNAIFSQAITYNYNNVVVCGCAVNGKLRFNVEQGVKTWLVPGGDARGSAYAIRDKAMCQLAALSSDSRFLAIWDGESRGTRLTFEHAIKLGLPGTIEVVR